MSFFTSCTANVCKLAVKTNFFIEKIFLFMKKNKLALDKLEGNGRKLLILRLKPILKLTVI